MKTYVIECLEERLTSITLEVNAENEEDAEDKAFNGEGRIIHKKIVQIDTDITSNKEKS